MGIGQRMIHVDVVNQIFQRQRMQKRKSARTVPIACGDADRRVGIDFPDRLRRLVLQRQIIDFAGAALIGFVDEIIAVDHRIAPITPGDPPPSFDEFRRKLLRIEKARFRLHLSGVFVAAGEAVHVDHDHDAGFSALVDDFVECLQLALKRFEKAFRRPALFLFAVVDARNIDFLRRGAQLPAEQIGIPLRQIRNVVLPVPGRRHHTAHRREIAETFVICALEIFRQRNGWLSEENHRIIILNFHIAHFKDAGGILKADFDGNPICIP